MILWKLCRRGHELSPENVYFGTGVNGPFSQCLVCKRAASKEYEKTRKPRPHRHRKASRQLNLQLERRNVRPNQS